MRTYELPDPSGEVTFHDVKNSYGAHGCYRVGTSEIEDPIDDVKWAAQYLADCLAAQDYENSTRIDVIANTARAAYHGDIELANEKTWDCMSEDYRNRWRAVARAVIDNA